ncbi:MAG TPA: hypothetical protein VKY74_20110 [Chloroflexia bacterium]|nr:hypothetical protein [Chloroflexia bacterium]
MPHRSRPESPAPPRVPLMEAAWRRRLAQQAGRAITRQPRLATLQHRLLALGGAAACFADVEPDLEALLAEGRVVAGPACPQPGWPGACHDNVAQLWHGQPATLQIVTGYALSADGCWRQHSWLLDSSARTPRLIETTVPRLLYFGRVLTAAQAGQFWADCGQPAGRPPGAGPAEDGAARARDDAADFALGQDAVGVRMLVGPGNFARWSREQDLPAALVARATQAAADLEAEIASRYPAAPDALLVGLVNAHLLLGAARFAAVAERVGIPAAGIATIAAIAQQHTPPDTAPAGEGGA